MRYLVFAYQGTCNQKAPLQRKDFTKVSAICRRDAAIKLLSLFGPTPSYQRCISVMVADEAGLQHQHGLPKIVHIFEVSRVRKNNGVTSCL